MLGFQKLKEDGMLKHLEKSGGIWNEKRTIYVLADYQSKLPIQSSNWSVYLN